MPPAWATAFRVLAPGPVEYRLRDDRSGRIAGAKEQDVINAVSHVSASSQRFRAYSAESHPKGRVHPFALDLLRNLNYPTEHLRSKSWDEFAQPGAPKLDFVFTVCDDAANETCPIWPGQPMSAHWGVPEPAAVEGSEAVQRAAFADTCRMMNNRISVFTSLPIRSLDRLSLQKRLHEIGECREAPAAERV